MRFGVTVREMGGVVERAGSGVAVRDIAGVGVGVCVRETIGLPVGGVVGATRGMPAGGVIGRAMPGSEPAPGRAKPGFDPLPGRASAIGGEVPARRACGGGIVLPVAPVGRLTSTGGGCDGDLRPGRYATTGCCDGRFSRGCDAGGCDGRLKPASVPRTLGGGFVDGLCVCSTLHAWTAHRA
jgi:hypothetical protein